jgi:hypothetical protein
LCPVYFIQLMNRKELAWRFNELIEFEFQLKLKGNL